MQKTIQYCLALDNIAQIVTQKELTSIDPRIRTTAHRKS